MKSLLQRYAEFAMIAIVAAVLAGCGGSPARDDASAQRSAETSAEPAVEQVAAPSADESTAKSVEKSLETPVEKKTRRSVDRSARRSAKRSADASADKSSRRAARKSSKRSGKNPAEETDTESVVPPAALEQYDRAIVLVQQGQYSEAELALLKVALDYVNYAGPWINLGIVYERTDRPEKAEEAYREAIARNPENPVPYNQLGILYRKQGRFDEADEAYSKATGVAPEYAIAYLNHGVLLDLYLQRPTDALERFQQYQLLQPEPTAKHLPDVDKWIAELTRRIESSQKTAQVQP